MENINLTIPAELLAAVDEARGDVPRTVWIRRAIEQRLDTETAPMNLAFTNPRPFNEEASDAMRAGLARKASDGA